MKKSDIKKLQKKTVADLQKDLEAAREELRTLKFDLAAGKVKNISKATEIRKKIARILTFMKQKAIEQEEKNEQENG